MYKLLIVDDEPLVQIGVSSMLDWNSYNITICGTASNGEIALHMIEEDMPDLVICDIKMPVMDGLQLLKYCRETYGELPVFLILTSYEEFQLAKEALKYGVLDYLVKLELDRDSLSTAVQKALDFLNKHGHSDSFYLDTKTDIQGELDKFFIRLLHNLFEDEAQFALEVKELHLDFSAPYYTVCYCQIKNCALSEQENEQLFQLYFSTIQMVREIIVKYLNCYITGLDMKHFSILVPLEEAAFYGEMLSFALHKTFLMVQNYFNVTILTSVGSLCKSPSQIAESYQDARQIASLATLEEPLLFYDLLKETAPDRNAFNLSLFKDGIIRAFDEFDTVSLKKIFEEIISLFAANPTHYLQAMDAASNILYLAISLLPDGHNLINQMFADYPDGYRSLYRLTATEQVLNWLEFFQEQLCLQLEERKKNYKNPIVSNVQHYIMEHIEERLTLNDVASFFGVSPNYLSQLFKKYSEIGFSEYISQQNIARAKEYMSEGNLKMYEIAERLGFESAFYFSKVFKKVTGFAPRDYMQTLHIFTEEK